MKRGGIRDTSIAHHLKHRDLQSLQHYLEQPTIEEKKENAVALFNYTVSNPEEKVPTEAEKQPAPQPQQAEQENIPPLQPVVQEPSGENVLPENAIIPLEANLDEPQPTMQLQAALLPIPNSQINQQNNVQKQAPLMFGGATFNNCTFNFQMPQ